MGGPSSPPLSIVLCLGQGQIEQERSDRDIAKLQSFTQESQVPNCLDFATTVRHEADVLFREGFYLSAIRKVRVRVGVRVWVWG
jgi:hypothetical protein